MGLIDQAEQMRDVEVIQETNDDEVVDEEVEDEEVDDEAYQYSGVRDQRFDEQLQSRSELNELDELLELVELVYLLELQAACEQMVLIEQIERHHKQTFMTICHNVYRNFQRTTLRMT